MQNNLTCIQNEKQEIISQNQNLSSQLLEEKSKYVDLEKINSELMVDSKNRE